MLGKLLCIFIIILVLWFWLFVSGCTTMRQIFPPNPHPELNREFNWRYDTPGEYPY